MSHFAFSHIEQDHLLIATSRPDVAQYFVVARLEFAKHQSTKRR
jgi:hypothetical protein